MELVQCYRMVQCCVNLPTASLLIFSGSIGENIDFSRPFHKKAIRTKAVRMAFFYFTICNACRRRADIFR